MLLPYYAGLFGSILLGVFGQLLLKNGADRSASIFSQLSDPFTIAGLLVYALSALFYIVSLRKLPLSIAFPSCLAELHRRGSGQPFVLWQEPLGWLRMGAMAFIPAGRELAELQRLRIVAVPHTLPGRSRSRLCGIPSWIVRTEIDQLHRADIGAGKSSWRAEAATRRPPFAGPKRRTGRFCAFCAGCHTDWDPRRRHTGESKQ